MFQKYSTEVNSFTQYFNRYWFFNNSLKVRVGYIRLLKHIIKITNSNRFMIGFKIMGYYVKLDQL
jgi:hypothetical protein